VTVLIQSALQLPLSSHSLLLVGIDSIGHIGGIRRAYELLLGVYPARLAGRVGNRRARRQEKGNLTWTAKLCFTKAVFAN
jgi:hypothetical protein